MTNKASLIVLFSFVGLLGCQPAVRKDVARAAAEEVGCSADDLDVKAVEQLGDSYIVSGCGRRAIVDEFCDEYGCVFYSVEGAPRLVEAEGCPREGFIEHHGFTGIYHVEGCGKLWAMRLGRDGWRIVEVEDLPEGYEPSENHP